MINRIIIKLYDSFIEGNNRENARKDVNASKKISFIEHELGATFTRNGTDIGELHSDIKFPWRNREMHNEGNSKYFQFKVHAIILCTLMRTFN